MPGRSSNLPHQTPEERGQVDTKVRVLNALQSIISLWRISLQQLCAGAGCLFMGEYEPWPVDHHQLSRS